MIVVDTYKDLLLLYCTSNRLDIQSRKEFNEEIQAALKSHPNSTIVFNLSNIDYIDSCILGVMVELLGETRKKHINLYLYQVSEHVMKILKIVKCESLFTYIKDLEEIKIAN